MADIADHATDTNEAAITAATQNLCRALREKGECQCIDCGEEIEPARRAAAPFAKRCITCQTSAERR